MGAARLRPPRHELPFARWIAGRARAGDELDVMVHEPFADFIGPSLIQPARALVQRSMTRAVGLAQSVAVDSGLTPRVAPMLRPAVTPRVLPVPGTIPSIAIARALPRCAAGCSAGRRRWWGHFAGGRYVEAALDRAFSEIAAERTTSGSC